MLGSARPPSTEAIVTDGPVATSTEEGTWGDDASCAWGEQPEVRPDLELQRKREVGSHMRAIEVGR